MLKSIVLPAALLMTPVLMGCSSGADAAAGETPNAQSSIVLTSQLPDLSGEPIWTVDRSQSKLQFRAEHNGDSFTGDFAAFDAAIKLDLDNPAGGEIHAFIDIGSVDAKDDDRNANLPSKAWFDVKSFPLATYSATDISGSQAGGYTANGVLSIKGIERPVTLSFTVETEGDMATARGSARFSRQDFKVGTGADFDNEDWVKFPIEVLVSLTATRKAN